MNQGNDWNSAGDTIRSHAKQESVSSTPFLLVINGQNIAFFFWWLTNRLGRFYMDGRHLWPRARGKTHSRVAAIYFFHYRCVQAGASLPPLPICLFIAQPTLSITFQSAKFPWHSWIKCCRSAKSHTHTHSLALSCNVIMAPTESNYTESMSCLSVGGALLLLNYSPGEHLERATCARARALLAGFMWGLCCNILLCSSYLSHLEKPNVASLCVCRPPTLAGSDEQQHECRYRQWSDKLIDFPTVSMKSPGETLSQRRSYNNEGNANDSLFYLPV